MNIKNLKYFKYFFWLGPILSIIGITAGFVSDSWGALPLALIITGIVIIGLWLIFFGNSANEFWRKRSIQTGTNVLISTVAMLIILGLINFLGIRYATRIDLTENKIFTLSPESQKVIRNLKQPVKVWMFEADNLQAKQLLDDYRRYGVQFSYEFVDPQKSPGLAQKFNVQKLGEVYLEAGKRRQLLQTLNEGDLLSEAKLTNSIQKITSDRTDKVYFLQGHGEHPIEGGVGGLSQAVSVIKEKNYTVESLNLADRLEIPKDAAVVVVSGPKRALFDAEVIAIKNYLEKGGSLLLMVDPNINSGLDNLLKEWGIKLDNKLVIDASGKGRLVGLGPATSLVSRYGSHPITKDFGKDFSFYPLARPVEITPIKGIEQTPLLITDDKSWAESTPEKQPFEFNPEKDRPGPITLGVALSRVYPNPLVKKLNESRLVVLGNSDFATDGLFDKQLNGDVFLNSVIWLSQSNGQTISIRPKESKNRRINMTPQQGTILSWIAVLFMPLFGFITAGFIWWRRR